MTLASQRDTTRAGELASAMLDAARTAADFIRSSASGLATLDWREKARADFVSDVDVGAEARIADSLHRRFPSAVVLGEELTPSVAVMEDLAFVVDPLDGTTNFLHGYPQYAVSIAAISGGDTLAGVVLDVARDSVCSAIRGGGALRDGAPIRVSATTEPRRALIGTGFPFRYPHRLGVYMPQLTRVIEETAGVRRAGAAALDLTDVASGRLDGFWELMLAPWDVAAGFLIIREAGGRVTDLDGHEARPAHGPVVASNGVLHEWLLERLSLPDPGTPATGSRSA